MKCTVFGRIYSETASYYKWDSNKEFPKYDKIEGTEQKWIIDVESLREAEKWFVQNHPDMYMGGGIKCENGDFALFAVPSSEYGKGNYETQAARTNYVRACML